MDTVSAIKGIIMGIAAQGAVTVTVPADSEIVRELGPIEMTRQVGPITLRVQTGKAKTNVQAAPPSTSEQANTDKPEKTEEQPASSTIAAQTPPSKATSDDQEATESGYEGLWYDHTGRSAIQISNCGDGLCGRIAWLKDSAHQSVCGTDILGDVKKVGNVYDNGWIYDIERDKKFDVELKLVNENKLRVKGYAGTKLLSKTFLWNRAPSDLSLCS